MKFLLPQKEPFLDSKEIKLPGFAVEKDKENAVEKADKASMGDFPHYKKVSNYLLGSCIGEGSFAKVRVGLHFPTKEKVAVKIVNKQKAKLNSYTYMNLHREGRLMQMLRHPNIVQILDILETSNNYYLITELCPGGDMIDVINKVKSLSETVVRRYVTQIVDAVEYLHKKKIVHRDLKIENILLDNEDNIKIIDFGLSNVVSSTNSDISRSLVTQCGSPAYAAPELLAKQSYGPKVDVWSIGVIAYALIVGDLPFTVEPFNLSLLCKKMQRGEMNPFPPSVSATCRSFIQKLLNPDEKQRPAIEEVKNLSWLTKQISPTTATPNRNPGYVAKVPESCKPNDVRVPKFLSYIDPSIIAEMKNSFGYEYPEIVRCVQRNKPGPILATYHLLKKRKSTRCINDTKKLTPNRRKKENFGQCKKKMFENEKTKDGMDKVNDGMDKNGENVHKATNASRTSGDSCEAGKRVGNKLDECPDISSNETALPPSKTLSSTKETLFSKRKDAELMRKKKDLEDLILKVALMANTSSVNDRNKCHQKPTTQKTKTVTNLRKSLSHIRGRNTESSMQPQKQIKLEKAPNVSPLNTEVCEALINEKISCNRDQGMFPHLPTKTGTVFHLPDKQNVSPKLTLQPLRGQTTHQAKVRRQSWEPALSRSSEKNARKIRDAPPANQKTQRTSAKTKVSLHAKEKVKSLENSENHCPTSRLLPALQSPAKSKYRFSPKSAAGNNQKLDQRTLFEEKRQTTVLLSQKWRKLYGEKSIGFLTKYNNYLKNYPEKPLPRKSTPKRIISEPIANVISCFVSAKQQKVNDKTSNIVH